MTEQQQPDTPGRLCALCTGVGFMRVSARASITVSEVQMAARYVLIPFPPNRLLGPAA
jgi:hypothetical protein